MAAALACASQQPQVLTPVPADTTRPTVTVTPVAAPAATPASTLGAPARTTSDDPRARAPASPPRRPPLLPHAALQPAPRATIRSRASTGWTGRDRTNIGPAVGRRAAPTGSSVPTTPSPPPPPRPAG